MSSTRAVLKLIKEKSIEFVDFRFTDTKGMWQHITQHVRTVDADLLENGIFFDGSSIAGWKAINESDMILKPDLETATICPFAHQNTLIINCDVVDPSTNDLYLKDTRSIAKKAEAYMASTGIADQAFFGPEAEFFLFDHARFQTSQNLSFYEIDDEEGPYNSGTDYEFGNTGHRPGPKGGYVPVSPIDSTADIRSEMLSVLEEMGVETEKHHHEVAPSQNELGIKFSSMVDSADNIQKYKYVVHNVALENGKTATFMPKPVFGDNGSGMHVHQSLWKKGKPLFLGDGYANLSETALYYIGGIIKHARALNAFTNPSTNSYKRLIPGYEAPVMLAYSSRNRSASIRIPIVTNDKATRIEVRFPDPMANPYLAFSAMLMAGLDGIKNKIHPGEAMDKNLYDLPKKDLKKIPTVCHSLRCALDALDKDRKFLKQGDVFTDRFIDSFIDLKMEEVIRLEHTPHPVEFEMYYSN